MRKIVFKTFGCRLNQYESQWLREEFELAGMGERRAGNCSLQENSFAAVQDETDICVVNTCCVTIKACREARNAIRSLARRSPKPFIVVTGCYARISPEEVSAIDGVDLVEADPKKVATEFLKVPLLPGIKRVEGRDKAFVKVQEGCDQFCAYCIVPYARGKPRDRRLEDVIQEVKDLIDNGYTEFVLTGTNLGKREDLFEVVTSIEAIKRVHRIGLGSIEPFGISDDLLDFLGSSPKFLRYLHVPLQSGDDKILHSMGRWYSSNQYRDLIAKISEKIGGCAIGADVIVGFPGESENEFLNTRDLVADSPICRLHVFRYSRRPGTRALDLPNEPHEDTKKRRSLVLRDLSGEKWQRFRSGFVGKTLEVHVESAHRPSLDGQLVGMTDNYIRVLFGSGNGCVDLPDRANPSSGRASCGVVSRNDFANVRITKIDGTRTFGEIVDKR